MKRRRIYMAVTGTALTALGIICMKEPLATLSIFLGIGLMMTGLVYFVALFAVNRFQ